MASKTNAEYVAEEARTFRHLKESETWRTGDVYGGKDWGFLFTVGNPKETGIKDGDEITHGMMCYRPKRKL